MMYFGIDPGKSGAIAALLDDDPIEVIKLDQTEHDVAEWLIEQCQRTMYIFAILERAQAFPSQGVVSMFNYGANYGFLRGLLTAIEIPFDTVTPAKWQIALKCRTKGDKNVTKAKAQQLFPGYEWTHATSDAVLLAYYGRLTRK